MNIIRELTLIIEERDKASSSFPTLPNLGSIKPKTQDPSTMENSIRLLAVENERMRKAYSDLKHLFKKESRILNKKTVERLTDIVTKEEKGQRRTTELENKLKSKEDEISMLHEKADLLEKSKEATGNRVYIMKIEEMEKRIRTLKEKNRMQEENRTYSKGDNSLEVSKLFKLKLEKTNKILNKLQRDKSLIILENSNLRNQIEMMKKNPKQVDEKENEKIYDELSEIKSQINNLKEVRDDESKLKSIPNLIHYETKEQNKSGFDILYMENRELKERLFKLESNVLDSKKEADNLKRELTEKDYINKIEQLKMKNSDLNDIIKNKEKEIQIQTKEI